MTEHAKISEEKHQLILNAAQKRFAHFGISKTCMEEIASDIGLSKSSLYYYFTTKEDIFKAVIAREQKIFITRMEEIILKNIPAGRKLEQYILNQLSFLNELTNLRILNSQSYDELRPVIGDLFKNFAHEELRVMGHIMQEGKSNGEFAIDSTVEYAELLVHLLQGFRIRYSKHALDQFPDVQAEYLRLESELKLFARVIYNGIKKIST
jgi:TetR/AcrR family transcriptional repressor of mexJK operon